MPLTNPVACYLTSLGLFASGNNTLGWIALSLGVVFVTFRKA